MNSRLTLVFHFELIPIIMLCVKSIATRFVIGTKGEMKNFQDSINKGRIKIRVSTFRGGISINEIIYRRLLVEKGKKGD